MHKRHRPCLLRATHASCTSETGGWCAAMHRVATGKPCIHITASYCNTASPSPISPNHNHSLLLKPLQLSGLVFQHCDWLPLSGCLHLDRTHKRVVRVVHVCPHIVQVPYLGYRKRDDKGRLGGYTWMTYSQVGHGLGAAGDAAALCVMTALGVSQAPGCPP